MMENVTTTIPHTPEKALLITIDGPAGSGKTTVSRLLAEQLNYQYVDTGALYRCIAFEVNKAGIAAADSHRIQNCVRASPYGFARSTASRGFFPTAATSPIKSEHRK